ncbi:hypothetical protein Tco_0778149 [Tanacetum coccineum]
MTSLPKYGALQDAVGGWEWVDMMVLFCKRPTTEDREFARQISDLLLEIVVAYDDKVDFIRKLEAMSGINATDRQKLKNKILDSREEGAEFEVTGLRKAFVSSPLRETIDFEKGVTE